MSLMRQVVSGTARHPRLTLRGWRKQRHLSRAALVERLNERGADVSPSFLVDIETGRREPGRLELVVAIEELTGIPVETWPNFQALTRLLERRSA
jgi:transcriptional regulator with XRE-family HTH domain